MDKGLKKEISQFISGMKRLIASNKSQDGVSIKEVNKAMSFYVNKILCDALQQGKGDEFIFAHAILALEWNLMSRR